MMQPKRNNVFEVKEGCHFKLRGMDSEVTPEQLFASGEYQETERRILNALFAYRFLNRYNLTRLVGRGDIKRHLDKMIYQGMVEEYVIEGQNGMRIDNSLVAYQLSKKADQYLLKSQSRGYRRTDVPTDAEIIKTIRTNQYHIGMVVKNKDRIVSQKVHFTQEYREMGSVCIPSYIMLDNRLTLLALALDENDDGFFSFARTLLKLSGYLTEMEHTRFLIVWVAQSTRAVLESMEKFHHMKGFREMPVSYILDYNTGFGNPMNQICFVEKKENQRTELSRIIL